METFNERLMNLCFESQERVLDLFADTKRHMKIIQKINENPDMCIADAAMIVTWSEAIRELKCN